MVKTEPLRIYQGDTFRGTVIVTDEGNPATLAGYTARAQIRPDIADLAPGPPAATIQCTIANPNQIQLYIDPATVAALPDGPLIWDLQIDNGLDIFTLLRGPVYIGRQVTV